VSLAAAGRWPWPISSGALLWLGPAAALIAGVALGGAPVIFFSAVALITWIAAGLLLVDVARDRRDWIMAVKWSSWIVAGSGVALTAVSFAFPAVPKLAYGAIVVVFFIAAVCWASVRWTSLSMRPLRLGKEAVALLIVAVWLLYADSDWYLMFTMPFGTHHTTPYLMHLPMWWWFASLAVPVVFVPLQARRLGLSADTITAQWQSATEARALPRRHVAVTGVLLVTLAALFLSLDFILPRVGHQIYEGDEFGYVVSAYQLLQNGRFDPPHMPLISLYIAAILAVAGDNPTAMLIGNVGLVLAGVLFWIGTLRLLTSDLRVILLGGLLMASLRTAHLFVWTPLSETLNNTIWSAAIFFLIAAVRRPTWPFQAALGLTVALLLLCRSQNLGGVIGLLLVGTVLTLLLRANRQALAPKITTLLIGCFVVSALVPLLAWGEFRKMTTGKFQIFDGRGAEIMLGMNSPGVKYGLSAGAWQPNVERWRAENPRGSTADMLMATARYRIADPQETAEYLWYRALEFLNVRIALQLNSGVESIVYPNVQLFIGFIACILLLGTANRWIGVMIAAVFLPFMTTFMLIYSEARYRVPMDQMLTFGVAILAANFLFGTTIAPPARSTAIGATRPLPRRWITAGVAATVLLALLAGSLLVIDIKRGTHFIRLATAELKPAGSTVVERLSVEPNEYRQLPAFKDLLNESDMASLQGRMFCGQFELTGSLFKESLAYYKDNGVRGGARFSRGYPHADYNSASLLESTHGTRLKVRRVAISFAGAIIERGLTQRGKVSVIGRVSRLNEYYTNFAAADGYWFLEALYVARLDSPIGETCGH
jgi:hypothetical protein